MHRCLEDAGEQCRDALSSPVDVLAEPRLVLVPARGTHTLPHAALLLHRLLMPSCLQLRDA